MGKALSTRTLGKLYAVRNGVSITEGERVVKEVVEVICTELSEGSGIVSFRNLFSLRKIRRKPKQCFDPVGNVQNIPSRYVLTVKLGEGLKQRFND